MPGTRDPGDIYTKLRRIAKLAKEHPDWAFVSLAHHIDEAWLHEAHRRTRKDKAVGVDGQTAAEYAENLEDNLRSLLERFKSGLYRAPPVRRAYVPKEGGKKRPIGIPTFEDKILQRAVVMVVEAIYEQDFLDCSYGFRRGRSQHQALEVLWERTMGGGGGCWVLEVDIQNFFDELDLRELRGFLDRRVKDGVIRRVIHKWLKAGVMVEGEHWRPDKGTPQGGVISPLLANVYLHEVLDVWFEQEVTPRLGGRADMIRFADDVAMVFDREQDARKVLEVLPKRLGRYGLALHPEKTRLVCFRPGGRKGQGGTGGGRTFDFLGFTHYWGKSRRGNWVVKRKTQRGRLRRSIRKVYQWCRRFRHMSLADQRMELARKMEGHYGYYGITGNYAALRDFYREVCKGWRKWIGRRSNRARRDLPWFDRLLRRLPLPRPKVKQGIFRRKRVQYALSFGETMY